MTKTHCDVCGDLVDAHPCEWVEVEAPALDRPRTIFHVDIFRPGCVSGDFCINCYRKVLQALLEQNG